MTSSQPPGCLAVILALFGIRLTGPDAPVLPYRQRDDFLSPAELSFYRVLQTALGQRAVICPKVNLADLFFVPQPQQNQSFRNRIDRKHVDFVLCHPATMQPLCGIELDDASHSHSKRQERDQFVDQVFQAAGLPLVRIPVKSGYAPAALLATLEPHLTEQPAASRGEHLPLPHDGHSHDSGSLGGGEGRGEGAQNIGRSAPLRATPDTSAIPRRDPATRVPACPKCGVPMVQRTATKGPNAGQNFYGCPNYPRCRETAPIG